MIKSLQALYAYQFALYLVQIKHQQLKIIIGVMFIKTKLVDKVGAWNRLIDDIGFCRLQIKHSRLGNIDLVIKLNVWKTWGRVWWKLDNENNVFFFFFYIEFPHMWSGAYIKITNYVRRRNHKCGCGFSRGLIFVHALCCRQAMDPHRISHSTYHSTVVTVTHVPPSWTNTHQQ